MNNKKKAVKVMSEEAIEMKETKLRNENNDFMTSIRDKIKNIGNLAQSAPGVYSKIEEYSYHIRRGDPPFKAFMKKIGKGVETFTKGLEDIGSAISRF